MARTSDFNTNYYDTYRILNTIITIIPLSNFIDPFQVSKVFLIKEFSTIYRIRIVKGFIVQQRGVKRNECLVCKLWVKY